MVCSALATSSHASMVASMRSYRSFHFDQLCGGEALVGEELTHALACDPVHLLLEPIDGCQPLVQAVETLQMLERALEVLTCRRQALTRGPGGLTDLADPVELQLVRDLFRQVDDVVQPRCKEQDVFVVHGG